MEQEEYKNTGINDKYELERKMVLSLYFPGVKSCGRCSELFKNIKSEEKVYIFDALQPTRYKKCVDIQLQGDISLFSLFHGYCYDYNHFFCSRNTDWIPYYATVKRKYTNVGPTICLIHSFAVKKEKDGTVLFGDARGYTDSAEDFFDDFIITGETKIKQGYFREKMPYVRNQVFEGPGIKIIEKAYKMIWNE